MTPKDILIQELDNISDPLIVEVLDFLQFLKNKRAQSEQAALVTPAAPKSVTSDEVSVSSSYPLRGKQPYSYEGPFAPAVPLEDWNVLQ
ncbi:MAG: hypothetical protein AAF171_11095 [Cyanobacteria bacterium P01_A01_bin.116]